MAVKLYNDTDIQNIADSIRAKNGSGYTYKVSEMSAAINGLEVLNGETVSITPSTSAQTITPSSGHNGITEVNVAAVTSSIDSNIQAGNIKKDVSILGVTGTLNEGITPTGELAITSNGTYNVTDYASANVNVPEKQLGTKTITANGTYKATDDNLDGYSEVEVATTGVNIDDYFKSSASGVGSSYYPGIINFIKKVKSPLTIVGTSMEYLFSYCNLEELPQINTSNITNMSSLFSYNKATTLDLSGFDTSNVTDVNYMFNGCENLIEIPYFDMSNIQHVNEMFQNCQALITIPKLNWKSVNRITASDNYSSTLFYLSEKIKNIGGFENLGMAYSTNQSANYTNYTLSFQNDWSQFLTSLTHESLMNVINNLYDIKTKGCNAQKLILGTTNINKLTSEEIAIATEKGWTIS